MKVLHLPLNMASQLSVSVRGLRAIGVNARGVVLVTPGDSIQSHDEVEVIPDEPSLPRSMRWASQHAKRYATLMGAIAWADVLHWHFGALVLKNGLDLRWARFLRKPGVAEFWGSDIRVADIEEQDNPYFAHYGPADYRARQTAQRSFETQRPFLGFSCVVACASMLGYVRRDLFPTVHVVRQRLILSEYVPSPPDPERRSPIIVHSPSDPGMKGSGFVQAAIDMLKTKYDFTYRVVNGMPRREALAIVNDADIFVDQLLLGTHGLAALEAMAMAKPVVCYIKPSMLQHFSSSLPIVNANPDSIAEVLEGLLASGELRRKLGLQGRAYVEQYHDSSKLSHQLKAVYQGVLEHSAHLRRTTP